MEQRGSPETDAEAAAPAAAGAEHAAEGAESGTAVPRVCAESAGAGPEETHADGEWAVQRVEGEAPGPEAVGGAAEQREAAREATAIAPEADAGAAERPAAEAVLERAGAAELGAGLEPSAEPAPPPGGVTSEQHSPASLAAGWTALEECTLQAGPCDAASRDEADWGSALALPERRGELEEAAELLDEQLNQEPPADTEYNATDSVVDHINTSKDDTIISQVDELQKHQQQSVGEGQLWEVVGGAGRGGVVVREDQAISSEKFQDRLSTGSLVEGVVLNGDRLQYRLLSGAGPPSGWVSIKLKDKDLLIRREQQQVAQWAVPACADVKDEKAALPAAPDQAGEEAAPLPRLLPWRGRLQGQVARPRRIFRSACLLGAHHSGTNALFRELPRFFNLRFLNEHRADSPHLWKHTVVRQPPPLPRDALCICVVKDPAFWIQSLGRDPAGGTFYEIMPVRRSWLGASLEQVPAADKGQLFGKVMFNGCSYDDALDLWESTVRGYFDESALPSAQTVVLRIEDFTFNFSSVIKALAHYGLEWREDAPAIEPLDAAVKDHTHPKSTRRSRSEIEKEYRNPVKRYKGLTTKQKARLKRVDRRLTEQLGYDRDDAVTTWLPEE